MGIIYVLIPLSVILMVFAIGFFFWAVRNDQFDDLDSPALDILDDDDSADDSADNSADNQQNTKRNGASGHKDDQETGDSRSAPRKGQDQA